MDEEDKVLNIIEHYFSKHQPPNFHVNVLRQGVRREGNWWYVAIKPDPPDVRARDYSALMEQAEEDLETNHHLKLLLLPVLPGD